MVYLHTPFRAGSRATGSPAVSNVRGVVRFVVLGSQEGGERRRETVSGRGQPAGKEPLEPRRGGPRGADAPRTLVPVETGPYRLVRHPIYTGFIVAYAGIAILC